MAPLLLPCLFGSLTRQLSQVARCAAFGSLPAVGAQRCISTITATTMRFKRFVDPMCKPHMAFLSPLLGQCQQLLCVQPSAGMKTKTALKRRCKDCFFVRRRGRLFVFCKSHPRHKQRQGWINWDLNVCFHATGCFSNEDLRITCLDWCIEHVKIIEFLINIDICIWKDAQRFWELFTFFHIYSGEQTSFRPSICKPIKYHRGCLKIIQIKTFANESCTTICKLVCLANKFDIFSCWNVIGE